MIRGECKVRGDYVISVPGVAVYLSKVFMK